MIEHITYQLIRYDLRSPLLYEFMELIGFEEVEADDPFEHGYDVRWFESQRYIGWGHPTIHVVADAPTAMTGPWVKLGLGHFCVRLGEERFNEARRSRWCTRDSGSGRAWLAYGNGKLRVEIRP